MNNFYTFENNETHQIKKKKKLKPNLLVLHGEKVHMHFLHSL